MDYIKLKLDKNKHFEVCYGTGLNKSNEGKSPLIRNLKLTLKGDDCDNIFATFNDNDRLSIL